MLQRFIILLLIFFFFCGENPSEIPEDFSWTALEKIGTPGQNKDKKIFLFFCADWSDWSNYMLGQTLADSVVQKTLAKYFVNVKIDCSDIKAVHTYHGEEFATDDLLEKLEIGKSFPVAVFQDEEGKYINRLNGFKEVKDFLDILAYIYEDRYKTMKWSEYSRSLRNKN